MTDFSRIAVILLSVFLLGACGTVKLGRDFDVGVFTAKIEQGATTQTQVRSWLGEPTSVGVSLDTGGERFDEWAYYFAEGEMADMSTAKVKILQSSLTSKARYAAITGRHPGNKSQAHSPWMG